MLFHNDAFFSIYFGDARKSFVPAEYKQEGSIHELLKKDPFAILKKNMRISDLLFLHQVHGAQGLNILSRQQMLTIKPFSLEGDFIITNVPHLGLGVATADCLPIIMYDSFNQVVAMIHAGWRGSVQKIAVVALERMQELFKSEVEHIRVFFGPSAKACCYVVGDDVVEQLECFSYASSVIYTIGNDRMFDVPLLNRLQLEEQGIKKDAFHLTYNICTICDLSFCSYRRNGPCLDRQMTVVALK